MTVPSQLSARQQRILSAIAQWVQEHGYPPTVREIGAAVGLVSPSSVAYQLKELVRKGYVRRDPDRPRAVTLDTSTTDRPVSNRGSKPVWIPLLGTIAAGVPITAEESIEDYLPLPPELVGQGELFCLHVKGDSMIEAAICEGDIVVVRQQPTAENGDIVAAMLDGEATVKVYRRKGAKVMLEPRNQHYQPLDGTTATILGKVVSVFRRL
ncbi:transcriptional repressor LexA [Catelliglobosispora koreensis]|uniref:transcriptional repressor LexA n=1 Tax=Catelliglobosispora koreensis TaxID=129052 RepID=UPI0003730670|nr:transcriptional repressor LexA [Catelliglobosispora koreensis]